MLKDDEMILILGGSINNWSLGIILGSIITIIVGIIDGYLRPLKCNK